jgi:hypothetical protein
LLIADRVLLNTAKVNVDIEPPYLRASTTSSLTIKVYPVNTFGFRNLLGKTEVRFEVEQGDVLISLENMNTQSVTVRSNGIEGEAIVGVYSLRLGVLISKVLIKILPLGVA